MSHRLHLRPHAKYVYLNSLETLKFVIANLHIVNTYNYIGETDSYFTTYSFTKP